jgi:ribosomal protein S7
MNIEKIIGYVCGTVGLLGVGYAIGANSKLKSVSEVVNKSVNSMIVDGKVDIPQEMVDETIKNRVTELVDITARWKVNEACNKAVREVETSLYNKISEAAENAVKTAYKTMEIDAKEKISKELRNIDISDLKTEVKDEAAQLIKDKLSSQMDDILDTYNANLINVQNIYSSIAKSMSARA